MELLDILYRRGDLSRTNVEMIEIFMQRWEVPAYNAILETKVLSEGRLADVLADQFALERIYIIQKEMIEPEVLKLIGFKLAKEYSVMPLNIMKVNDAKPRVRIAFANPGAPSVKILAEVLSDYELVPCIASLSEIKVAINALYSIGERLEN